MDKILEIIHGSRLYGLDNEKSDTDIYGIYLESREDILHDYLYGTNLKGREIDLSEVYKLPNGKNSPESTDKKFLSFKKYIGLALNQNPGILEVMFAPENKILNISEIGKELIEHRFDFLSKKIYYTFKSYAVSQAKKARLKAESFKRLENLQKTLETEVENNKDHMFNFQTEKWFRDMLEIKQHHYKVIGTDYQIVKNLSVKKFIKEIEKTIGQRSNRIDLIKKNGTDTKFLSHTVRLLCESEELLTEGNLTFPLKEKDFILSIKNGEVPLEDVEQIVSERSKRLDRIFETTKLPDSPNTEKINKFVKEVYRREIFK